MTRSSSLTSRGRLALLAAVGLYLLGWGFGMREAVPVAIGLALACAVAAVWVRLVVRPLELVRSLPSGRVEGATIDIAVELRRDGGMLPGRAVLWDEAGRLGWREVEVRREHGALRGGYRLHAVPRGRYVLARAQLRVEDPFGLEVVQLPLERDDALSVYPRVELLESLFSDGGPLGGNDRRLVLSRVAGYDLHGVRDHQRGESLRAVHWKTSARLRKLMVKEFEDTPRDEAVVVLDARAGSEQGSAPDSSFEMQVRAAASLLRRIAASGQRSGLVVAGRRLQRQRIVAFEHDWPAALEVLAAVEPDGSRPLAAVLADAGAPVDAVRLWLVTALLDPALVDAAATLLASRREVAVVLVDADSWSAVSGGGPIAGVAELDALGVPVSVLRRGDDLHDRLATRSEPQERRERRAPTPA